MDVLDRTLAEVKRTGETTSNQTSDLIHEAQAMSDALEVSNGQNRKTLSATIAQNKKSLEDTLSQAQKGLDASVDSSRTDRRAWVTTFDARSIPKTA